MQDVVSFPPLTPRKKTIDWYSPLPPIEVEMPRRSLYDIGVDVSFGLSSTKTVTPRSPQTSWVRSTQVPSRSIEFNPNYEIRFKIPGPHSNDDASTKTGGEVSSRHIPMLLLVLGISRQLVRLLGQVLGRGGKAQLRVPSDLDPPSPTQLQFGH